MKNGITSKILIAAVIVILAMPIISDMINSNLLKSIDYSEYKETVDGTKSYGFALLYADTSENKEVKDQKKSVKEMISKHSKNLAETSVEGYYMDTKKMSAKELENVFGDNKVKSGYVFIVNSEILRVEPSSISNKDLEKLISEYSSNEVSDDLVFYKNIKDSAQLKKLTSRKKDTTMAVFGRDSCFYCNQFKLVYNTLAEEKNVDIYYVNSDKIEAKEYEKIMDMKFKIPASCSDSGKEEVLESGFGTPLTLFIKNGKVKDCINGYINKKALTTKLETLGMIK